ncbi:MAG: tRNA (guanosine(46)-N7)-methyltransferase TrmB [Gammaproteobacteria bacterium]|nr:tRNA (guanosine(46)-N7)-methyltransferase TrmB [Gammaproteobacteria bacterium]
MSFFHRKIKSYVVRNRVLPEPKDKLYKNLYSKFGLPNLDLDQNLDQIQIWDFSNIFNNNNPVILEIGFGTGDSLLKNAESSPNYNYIGIEVYKTGLFNILNNLNNLTNLRVCEGDAVTILAKCIADKVLAGVQIFFPDPWPKSRHHKRRLIQPDFIALLSAKIMKNGFLHLATDWEDYGNHMQRVVMNNTNFSLYNNLDNQRLLTKFERRGLEFGYKIVDLKYQVTT